MFVPVPRSGPVSLPLFDNILSIPLPIQNLNFILGLTSSCPEPLTLFDSIVGLDLFLSIPNLYSFVPRPDETDTASSQCPSLNLTQFQSLSIWSIYKTTHRSGKGSTLVASYLGRPGLPGLGGPPEAGDDLHEVVVSVGGQRVAPAIQAQWGAPGDQQIECHVGSFLQSARSVIDQRQIPHRLYFNYSDIPNRISSN